jgi:hypothetical protein
LLFVSRIAAEVEAAEGVPTVEEAAVALDESAVSVMGDSMGEGDGGAVLAAWDSQCRDRAAAANTPTKRIVAALSA